MVKFTMFLVRLLRVPLGWMGADFNQLEIILNTKLTIDFRRGPSMYQSASSKKKQTFSRQLIMYGFVGFFIALGFKSINDLLLNFTIAYSVIMVMMSTTLISEFTSVLFDHRDNHILLVRPVSSRTLLLSRLLHIQFYIMYIALALSVGTAVFTVFKYGVITALFFVLGVGVLAWITLLITTLFYLLVSKVVNGERFKDLINYVQIALTIVIMGGYQILPRMMEVQSLKHMTMPVHGYSFLIPPVWVAAWVQLSKPEGITLAIVGLAVTAFVVAVLGAVLMVRFLSGGFNEVLSQSSENEVSVKKVVSKDRKLSKNLNRFFCISELEKSGWKMVMSITSRDRKFKQAIYPMYGFMFVMVFVFLRPDMNDFTGWFEHLKDTRSYLVFVFLGYFGTTSLTQMRFTDTPEACWVYKALPLTSPGHILTGAIKAMLLKFFVPMYTILTVAVSFIWGFGHIPVMVLGAVLIVLETLITLSIQNTPLPFSEAREMQQKGSNSLKMLLGMAIMGVIVGFVFLASFLPIWAICLISALSIGLNAMVFKSLRKSTFEMA
jgi:ABC-2 type transport system permease protein